MCFFNYHYHFMNQSQIYIYTYVTSFLNIIPKILQLSDYEKKTCFSACVIPLCFCFYQKKASTNKSRFTRSINIKELFKDTTIIIVENEMAGRRTKRYRSLLNLTYTLVSLSVRSGPFKESFCAACARNFRFWRCQRTGRKFRLSRKEG